MATDVLRTAAVPFSPAGRQATSGPPGKQQPLSVPRGGSNMSEVSVIKEGWLHKRGERCPACPVRGPELAAGLLRQWRPLPWAAGHS